jgi:DNA primase
MKRFTRRCVVNYDPDTAGQAATERSLTLLLEQDFEVRVLALPGGADPDKFIRESGATVYAKLVEDAPAFVDYLIDRARKMDLSTAEGKLRAVNFLMPYVQRIPNRLLRSEWATRIASQLRIEEPVLRESMKKAAAERRDRVQPKAELIGSSVRPAERRLIQILVDADDFRAALAAALRKDNLHRGLETEKILDALIEACESGARPDPTALSAKLDERERRLLFDIVFESAAAASWEEAESCLASLRRRHIERELSEVQKSIEANPTGEALRVLLARKQELRKQLGE